MAIGIEDETNKRNVSNSIKAFQRDFSLFLNPRIRIFRTKVSCEGQYVLSMNTIFLPDFTLV